MKCEKITKNKTKWIKKSFCLNIGKCAQPPYPNCLFAIHTFIGICADNRTQNFLFILLVVPRLFGRVRVNKYCLLFFSFFLFLFLLPLLNFFLFGKSNNKILWCGFIIKFISGSFHLVLFLYLLLSVE